MNSLTTRIRNLGSQPEMRDDFIKEMRRFLPAATMRDTVGTDAYWNFLAQLVSEQSARAVSEFR